MGNIGYRIRNCFTLANATALFVGVGVAMIGIFAPIAFSNIPQKTALVLFWVGIAFIAIGLAMAVWRYIKNPIEKKLRVFGIISVLDKMYKRLEILMNEERDKEIDLEKFGEILGKLDKLMQLNVPDVSSADEARKAFEDLEKRLPKMPYFMFSPDARREEILERIVRISRLMDKGGFGLKDRRKGDKKYCRLLKLVDEYYDENKSFIDEELRSLIDSCVDFNESVANFLLLKERFNTMLTLAAGSGMPNIFTPSWEADFEGFGDEARKAARTIRVRIGEKIKRLIKGNGN